MTADARDTATTSELAAQKKAYSVERPRVPLVLKLFGLTALLIVIVVGVAIGITIQRANRVANDAVRSSITGAAKLFAELETQRLGRLAIVTQILGSDPNVYAYIQESLAGTRAGVAAAPAAIDLASINDALFERREQLGTDVLMLLDDEGRVVARTDQPMVSSTTREDLYETIPLVRRIVDDASVQTTAGVVSLGGRLYHGAVAPLSAGARDVRIGYLLNAYTIDETFANRIAEATNAGVVFAPRSGGTPVRSSNAPSVRDQEVAASQTTKITVDQSRYIVAAEPLMSGTNVVGTAMFLRSLDRELAPFREIENGMLIGGGVALVLAFLLSWFIARRVTRPIEELATLAQAVTAGDYSIMPDIGGNDEVGILGRSFGKMINSLRDKAELEELYAAMAEKSGEPAAARADEPARVDEGTVLVTDLRGLAESAGEADAAAVIAGVENAMRLQQSEVVRQDGEVREIEGHRLVSIFRGGRGVIHAIRAARAINEELASHSDRLSIGAGIATGRFVTGSVALDHGSGFAIVGNAPLLALLFASDAPSGHAYISWESAESAGAEILTAAVREEVHVRSLRDPVAVAALPLLGLATSSMHPIGGSTAAATMRLDAGSTPAPAALELSAGHLFASRYRIEQMLGRGGMGVVYKATDTQLDEAVAIKMLPGDVMTRSPEDLERFKREIRLARRITHHNVLRTYDYGEAEGVHFISMEFVRGYTLADLLDQTPGRQIAPRTTVGIARQICRGLQAAHEQGIIHRDIKPQNVLIDAKGEVKLMDFGIARMTEAPEAAAMTQAGLVIGTPHYMSPEQVQGKQLDARTDVYSLGVLMYELLTGRRPFEASSLMGVLTAHLTEMPEPPLSRRPAIGMELNAIVMRCLEKAPSARHQDAGALLAVLERYRDAAAA